MSLTPGQARDALKDIEKTEGRSAAARHAHYAAPHLMLWGVVWAVGYLIAAIRPELSWLWWPLVFAGVLASFFVDHERRTDRRLPWRYIVSALTIAVFVAALFAVFQPSERNQFNAVAPLLVGVAYALAGLWSKGWRLLPLGLALIALTLAGFFLLPDYFSYWMAAVGGGGLVLGGLWLRSA